MTPGTEELYQYDPLNRLTAYTKNGTTTLFRYDHAVNLLSDDKARYSYDDFNLTTQVETFNGNIQVNRYDAEVLRHENEFYNLIQPNIPHARTSTAEGAQKPNVSTGFVYDAGDKPVRINGNWTIDDMKQALYGHPPRAYLSRRSVPGSVLPGLLHPNK